MICIIQGYKAFRVIRNAKNMTCILHSDGLILWRMHYQQCPVKLRNGMQQSLFLRIDEKLFLDPERSPTEFNHGFTVSLNLVQISTELFLYMCWITWCTDGNDTTHFRYLRCYRKNCRTTQTMPDQHARRTICLPQIICRCGQVGQI